MSITIKSNPDGVSGAIQVNGVDKVTIGANGITAGSFAPNSIDAAAAALAFSGANQSLAPRGYQKLPNGLIIQWGFAGPVNNGSALNVTFPITFPNALWSYQVTIGNTANVPTAPLRVHPLSESGMTINNSGVSSVNCSYVVIGY